MGYNTNLTIINDAMGVLERNPEELVSQIKRHMHETGSFGVGNHANPVYLQSTMHADMTQLIAAGGNFSTRVFSTIEGHGNAHHTPQGQVALLRAWADSVGYDLVERTP